MHIDEIYETEAFRLLAQGMKDRKAVDIIFAIKLYGGNAFDDFERWCSDVLEEQDAEIAASSVVSEKASGRWRVFEDTTQGYWGIEFEDAGNDDDAILYPQKINRDTVARIVDAHNASTAP